MRILRPKCLRRLQAIGIMGGAFAPTSDHRAEHEALQMFETILGCRNAFGLLSEAFTGKSESFGNNFPREDPIVGIISAVTRLSSTEREA